MANNSNPKLFMVKKADVFDYDVAFSFMQKDERLAYEISDLIQDRFSTFIYSKYQEELAGTDGEKLFGNVFGEKSRTVVVLYRNGWGTTPWTRIEETAIRNRAHETGYDFATFVKLDKDAEIPKWLPKNRIYYDFSRFGLQGLASVISARIQESGGETKPESIEEKAEGLKRHRKLEQDRLSFLRNPDALVEARSEITVLIEKFKALKTIIEDPASNLYLGFQERRDPPMFEFGHKGFFLCFNNSSPFEYDIESGKLRVSLYEKHGEPYFNYKEINYKRAEMKFDRDLLGNNGWSDFESGNNFLTTDELLDTWVRWFIDGLKKRTTK